MKRQSLLILTVALILLICCLFCACNNNDIPQGVPIGWQSYLEIVGALCSDCVK